MDGNLTSSSTTTTTTATSNNGFEQKDSYITASQSRTEYTSASSSSSVNKSFPQTSTGYQNQADSQLVSNPAVRDKELPRGLYNTQFVGRGRGRGRRAQTCAPLEEIPFYKDKASGITYRKGGKYGQVIMGSL